MIARFSFLKSKNIIVIALIAATLSPLVGIGIFNTPHIAFAQTGADVMSDIRIEEAYRAVAPANDEVGDCGFLSFNIICWTRKALTYLSIWAGWLIAAAAGLALNLAAGLITFLISESGSVTGSPIVAPGFKISLSIANLGFVFAIIVIAFATILRLENYGMKKLLRNLIIAAVAINFSLAIAGVFIDFSNVLGNYFIDAAIGRESIVSFATNLTGTFNPQALFEVKDAAGTTDTLDDLKGIALNILSVFFVLIFTVLAAIVMWGIALTLLVRYIALSFLLIVMPLAWLFWTFPGLTSYWSRWWSEFLKWIFYLPAMTFFLFLAILTSRDMKFNLDTLKGTELDSALSAHVLIPNPLVSSLQMITVLGVLVAGVIVAQKLGIMGAGVAMKGIASVKNSVIGATSRIVGDRARRLGTLPLRSEKGREYAKGLQGVGAGLEGKGETWIGKKLYGLGHFVTKPIRGAGSAAVELAGVKQGESLVEKAEKEQKNSSTEQLALQWTDMQTHQRVAFAKRAVKEGKQGMIPQLAEYIKSGNGEKEFKSYGAGNVYGDLEKAFGANTAMLKALSENLETLGGETKKFEQSFSPKDRGKNTSVIFKAYDAKKRYGGLDEENYKKLQRARLSSMTEEDPGSLAKIFPTMSKKDFDEFFNRIWEQIAEKESQTEILGHIENLEDRAKWLKENEQKSPIYRSLYKNLANRLTGIGGDAEGGEAGGEKPAAPPA